MNIKKEPAFTGENFQLLKATCDRISSLIPDTIDGSFTWPELIRLGELIKEFKNNPIVKNSGIK